MSKLPFAFALLAGFPAAAQFLHTDMALRATQGAEPGGFSAGNNDGAARYLYGFRLPAARGRYQPRLALSYASNRGNGPYGAGWSLNMSYIESSSRASSDSSGSPRKQLWLSLDGERRLLVAHPASQSTTYRPDIDTGYTLVTSTTDSQGRPAWSMVDGLGNQYVFQWLDGGSTATYGRWYLRSVTDVDSNTTLFEYNPEAGIAGASGLLSAIRYNNYGTYNNFANVVELSYGANPNPQIETIGSSLIMHTQLLNAVNIKRQNANTGALGLIYKYGITYEQSPSTGRQRVSKVVEFGQDSSTPLDQGTRFSYTGSANSYNMSASPRTLPALTGPSNLTTPTVDECNTWLNRGCSSPDQCKVSDVAAWIDIDGDGRADMVWGASGFTSGLRWARNTSTPGNVSFAGVEILPGSEIWPGSVTFNNAGGDNVPNFPYPVGKTRLIDVDGDGRPDLVTADSSSCPPAPGNGSTTQFAVGFNRNDPSAARAGLPYFAPPICMEAKVAQADWNAIAGVSSMRLSDGQGLVEIIDLTGDGIIDYVVATNNGWHVYPGYQTATGGWAFGPAITYLPAGTQPVKLRSKTGWDVTQDLVDMNGDGLLDFVTSSVVTSSAGVRSATWTVQYNAGPGGGLVGRPDLPSQPPPWSTNNPAVVNVADAWGGAYTSALVDINNDGRPDYLSYISCPTGPGFPTNGVALNTGLGFASAPQCMGAASNSGAIAFITPYYNGVTCTSQGSNAIFVDVDADGVKDWYYSPYGCQSSVAGCPPYSPGYVRGAFTDLAPPDLLTQIASPFGSVLSVSYMPSSYYGLAQSGNRVIYVVSQTRITGPGLQPLTTNYSYANPSIIAAWDEPTRREQLGYLDTYSQDSVTLVVLHRQWGSTHDTAGRVVKEELATSGAFGAGFSPSAVFEQTTHAWTSWSIAYANCPSNMSPPPAMAYPVLVFDSAATRSVIEGAVTLTRSTSVACSALDSAGNVLARTIVPDASAPSYTVFGRYPDPNDTTARCKNCILESWASTAPNGADLFRQRFHYDAPLGTSDPAPIAVKTGHLNYVEELVSGSGSSGTFEIGRRVAYNADGTIASARRDFAGQDVASVTTSYQYDSLQLNVTQERVSDVMVTGSSSATLVGDRTYDPATGLLISMTGPYLNGTPAGPTILLAFDTFGRLTDVGRQDGLNKIELAAYGYNSAGQAGSGSPGPVTWSASFAGQIAFPAARPLASTDDIIVATTYYDGLGRPVQSRQRLGTGTAGSAGQIVQHLATQYRVNAVVLDGAGRPVESLDPYYSSNSTFQDLNNGQTAELSTAGLHGTSFAYDAKSRMVCEVYWPVGGAINAAPTPCTSNVSSAGYRRAAALVYGTDSVGTINYATIDKVPDWRNMTSPPPVSPRIYMNASGWTMFVRDANLNLMALQHDVLGRTTGLVRYAGGLGSVPSLSTSSVYDLKGRVIQQTDDSFGTRIFTYSATGELVKVGLNPTTVLPEGQSGVQFRYGTLGRLENRWNFSWSKTGTNACGGGLYARTPSTPSTVPPDANNYFYDSASYTFTAGRLSTETNGIATTNFGYDWAGRPVVRDSAFKDNVDASGNPIWHSVNQALGNDGRVLSSAVRSPLLASPSQYFTRYDSFGRPVQVDDAGSPSTVYWAANNPAMAAPTTPTYDALARPTNTWLDKGASTHAYQYDPASNLEVACASSVTPAGQAAPNQLFNATGKTYLGTKLTGYGEAVSGDSYSYAYDTDGRLAQIAATPTAAAPLVPGIQQNILETYSHFLSGSASLWNLQTVTDRLSNVTGTYSYPAKGEQLVSIAYSAPAAPPPQDSYTYDVNGRVTAHFVGTTGAPVQTFSYDPEGHLNQISGPSGTEQLAYGAHGALVVRYQGSNKTIYVGANMTIRLTATTQNASVHVLLGSVRVASTSTTGPVLYYHRDHLGSIVATSLAGGAVGALYRYSAYGSLDRASGETINNTSELGCTGALKLSEGLLYLNARVYNPQMRRFLQPDNVDARRYAYAGGDPINSVDPSGQDADDPGPTYLDGPPGDSGGPLGDSGDPPGDSGDPPGGSGDPPEIFFPFRPHVDPATSLGVPGVRVPTNDNLSNSIPAAFSPYGRNVPGNGAGRGPPTGSGGYGGGLGGGPAGAGVGGGAGVGSGSNSGASTNTGVLGVGLSIGGQFFPWGGDVGVFGVIDMRGNVGVYVSGDMRLGMGLSFGRGPTGFVYPNMPSIEDLNGVTVGAGLDTPLASVQLLKNPTSLVPGAKAYYGVAVSPTPTPIAAGYVLGGIGHTFVLVRTYQDYQPVWCDPFSGVCI